MSEEKKEEKTEAPTPQAPKTDSQPKAEPKPEETQAAPQAVPVQEKAKEEKAPAAPVKKERPSNCAACNKSIKKKRWYYRNGKFYCTKRCWHTTLKKEETQKEATAEKK